MDLSRRDLLKSAGVAGITTPLFRPTSRKQSATSSATHQYIVTSGNWSAINNITSGLLDSDDYQVAASKPSGGIWVQSYDSYAAFTTATGLPAPGGWVMYDNEHWANTPEAEQNDPLTYMRLFCQLAHSRGLRVILAPARDLYYAPAPVNPPAPGQGVDDWYLNTGKLPDGAEWGDLFLIQSEVDETNLTNFKSLVNGAITIISNVNPWCLQFAELATSFASSTDSTAESQLKAAGQSVAVDGFYFSVSDGRDDVAANVIAALG